IAIFQSPALGPRRSVTVAAKCFAPTTFVDVPVDTVTAYLDPILTPACTPSGDPPSVGGRLGSLAEVRGELVWPQDGEFKMVGWQNVPGPIGESEKRAAYVFVPSSDPTATFQLPNPAEAVSPDIRGVSGFPFRLDAAGGNLTLYALAGVEDRT